MKYFIGYLIVLSVCFSVLVIKELDTLRRIKDAETFGECYGIALAEDEYFSYTGGVCMYINHWANPVKKKVLLGEMEQKLIDRSTIRSRR